MSFAEVIDEVRAARVCEEYATYIEVMDEYDGS